ncbi:MAG: 2-C-methyl-D-erythritol 4-phosphate cytidylyltransferase [Solirubrobacteraceae bacterium]
MAIAVLVAAGRGERLGAERPKAVGILGGKPMLQWSIDALAPAVDHVVVALPAGADAPPGTIGAPGGEHRSQSVRNALRVAPDGDPVVVHDAARPLITAELVADAIAALDSDHDAAIAAAPVSDTVKEVEGHEVRRTVPREQLWAVQTPQVFRRATLERALDVCDDVLARATDDAWLVERIGGRVKVVPFPPDNIKVTSPFDLEVAERRLC